MVYETSDYTQNAGGLVENSLTRLLPLKGKQGSFDSAETSVREVYWLRSG
jgi:hypothetical protein